MEDADAWVAAPDSRGWVTGTLWHRECISALSSPEAGCLSSIFPSMSQGLVQGLGFLMT